MKYIEKFLTGKCLTDYNSWLEIYKMGNVPQSHSDKTILINFIIGNGGSLLLGVANVYTYIDSNQTPELIFKEFNLKYNAARDGGLIIQPKEGKYDLEDIHAFVGLIRSGEIDNDFKEVFDDVKKTMNTGHSGIPMDLKVREITESDEVISNNIEKFKTKASNLLSNKKDDFKCYEFHRANMPAHGCTKQCNECKNKEQNQ